VNRDRKLIPQFYPCQIHQGRVEDDSLRVADFRNRLNHGVILCFTHLFWQARKEKAIKNWEIALQNVPESQKANRTIYEKALKDLKEK
jgi:hypothetical protein